MSIYAFSVLGTYGWSALSLIPGRHQSAFSFPTFCWRSTAPRLPVLLTLLRIPIQSTDTVRLTCLYRLVRITQSTRSSAGLLFFQRRAQLGKPSQSIPTDRAGTKSKYVQRFYQVATIRSEPYFDMMRVDTLDKYIIFSRILEYWSIKRIRPRFCVARCEILTSDRAMCLPPTCLELAGTFGYPSTVPPARTHRNIHTPSYPPRT